MLSTFVPLVGCIVLTFAGAHGKSVMVSPLEGGGVVGGLPLVGLQMPQHLRKCKEEEAVRAPSHSFQFKNLAGPPSEFTAMAQPTAASTSAYSGHYSTPFTLSPDITATNATGLTQTIDVMVDSSTGFAIASFATDTDATYTLVGPDGKDVPLSPHQVKVRPSPHH